ncbi:MAG: histidine phosphatase family protein [Pseudomonadota bacterium]
MGRLTYLAAIAAAAAGVALGSALADLGASPTGAAADWISGIREERRAPAAAEADPARAWAERMAAGGYILHVRHAQREKWDTVKAFDALEIAGGLRGEEASFRRAVCLTPRGEEEARAIGAVFAQAGVAVSAVISSPSCRARQTAELAFGRIDRLETALLYRTMTPQAQRRGLSDRLRATLLAMTPPPGGNIVLSGHGATIGLDDVVDVDETAAGVDSREETGVAVLEVVDGRLIARHVFERIDVLATAVIATPLDAPAPAPGPADD